MNPELHIRFEAAVQAALEGATVVTGTTRASRMLLSGSVRRLRTTSAACRTPDVLPLEALYQRLWRDAIVTGAASQALLSSSRCHALWRKVIAGSRHSGALLTTHGSARMAQDAWRVSQEYRVVLDPASVRGVAECEAFFEWSSLYKEESRHSGWVDSATLPDLLLSLLGDIADVLPKRLVVYGFDALTPQTSAFCDALKGAGTRLEVISTRISAASEIAGVVSAEGLEDEMHLAAAWSRQKLVTDSSQRIGIVVPRLREMRDRVESTFAEVLHPEEFLSPAPNPDRAFEVAAGRPLDQYAMVRHALLLLGLTFDELSIHDVGILLRSPYVGDPAEACARAMFDVALRKNGRPQYSAESLRRHVSSGTQKLRAPEKFDRTLRQLANMRPPVSRLLRPSEAAVMFNDALVAAHWPARKPDSGEYQLGERWDGLLGEFASLDGFLPAQSAPALVEEIARMAASVSFRPENSGAPVQIMEEDEAAGCAFDALWVCGLNDDWPQAERPNPYLPLALQRAAGVPNLGPGEQHASAAASLARFSASANEVILSWARQDEDRELRGNRLLRDFESLDVKTINTSPNYAAIQRASARLEYVDDEHAPAADPATLPHTGTNVLKYQAHCPFRAFAELRLGGEELESPELGLDRRVRGKLVESALQNFWTEVRDSDSLRDLLPAPRLAEIVEASIDKAFQEHWGQVDDAWNDRLRRLERERLRKLLDEWRKVELLRTPFEVMIGEQQQNIEVPLGGITIHARIDRVDRVRGGGFVVIDYKSGRSIPSPSAWSGDRPDEPQLPLYVVDQLNQDREVSAVAFAHLSSAKPAFKGYGRNRAILGLKQDKLKSYLKGMTFDEHLRRWHLTLDQLAADFVHGEVKVDPKLPPSDGESTCDRCHLQAVCRVAEMTFVGTNGDSAGNGDGDE